MDGRHPVLQVCLVAGLRGQRGRGDEVARLKLPHYTLDSDVAADKSAAITKVLWLCYFVIYYNKKKFWVAGWALLSR